jgi:nitric oxide reductase activation protein
MSMERRNRQLQGIDIDIDAAVASQVEAIAGSAPEEGVYIDLVRRRRDLAVLLLLDVSGSVGEPGAGGRTVYEHQRAAAGALTTALHDLGDRVALYAFRSQGRTSVQVIPLKRFGDRLDAQAMVRLARCVPGAYTRLGAAIRHGAAILERQAGMSRRLLVVLSDGLAYDHGYEGAYGEADARRALAEVRRRGTGCLCLSLGGASDPAALRRVFGTAAHASVPMVDQLPDVVGPLFRFALRSAEAQRRVFQRKIRTKERLEMERLTA